MKLYIKEFYKEENVIEIGSDNMLYWFYRMRNTDKYFFKGIGTQSGFKGITSIAYWTKNEPNKYSYEEYHVNVILQLIKECKSHYFHED